MINKTHLKVLFVAILLPFAAGAYANSTNNKLSKVFDSYSVNNGGSYSTTQGSYWHGGSFQGRVDQQDVTLVRFTPPSISGSCSGIDIFAGSFGLVSGDEIVQVARGIAQGAAPYFFNLAMQSICPSCQGIMEEFGGMVNDLNQHGQNSCQNLLDGVSEKYAIGDKLDGFFGSEGNQIEAEAGAAVSWMSNFRDTVKGKGQGDAVNNTSSATRDKLISANTLAYALSDNGATMTIPALGLSTTKNTIEFIISLTGTTVYSAMSDAACSAAKASDDKCYDTNQLKILMSLDTLYNGAVASQPFTGGYRCNDEECLVATPESAGNDINGLKADFERLINGEGAVRGMIDKYRFQENLTAEQLVLLQTTRYPFHMIARKIKGEGAKELGTMVAHTLARNLIADVGDQVLALLWTARAATRNSSLLAMYEKDINSRIDVFEKTLEYFKEKSSDEINDSIKSKEALLAQLKLLELRV